MNTSNKLPYIDISEKRVEIKALFRHEMDIYRKRVQARGAK